MLRINAKRERDNSMIHAALSCVGLLWVSRNIAVGVGRLGFHFQGLGSQTPSKVYRGLGFWAASLRTAPTPDPKNPKLRTLNRQP